MTDSFEERAKSIEKTSRIFAILTGFPFFWLLFLVFIDIVNGNMPFSVKSGFHGMDLGGIVVFLAAFVAIPFLPALATTIGLKKKKSWSLVASFIFSVVIIGCGAFLAYSLISNIVTDGFANAFRSFTILFPVPIIMLVCLYFGFKTLLFSINKESRAFFSQR